MTSFITLLILIIATILSFVLLQPKERPPLGIDFWRTQEKSGNDLAKTFSFNGDADRLIEMLKLDKSLIPKANEFRSAAAVTGVPMLFRKHEVSWEKAEAVIIGLLRAIDEIPENAIYALSILGIDNRLGALEEDVVNTLIIVLQNPNKLYSNKTIVKACEALSYIQRPEAIEPLKSLLNDETVNLDIRNAAGKALEKFPGGTK